jgi:ribonuclease HI
MHSTVEAVSAASTVTNITAALATNNTAEICAITRAVKQARFTTCGHKLIPWSSILRKKLAVAQLAIKLMMEAVRTSETSVDNHFTRQYIPEDSSEH